MEFEGRQIASIEVYLQVTRADGTAEPQFLAARTAMPWWRYALLLAARVLAKARALCKRLLGAPKS